MESKIKILLEIIQAYYEENKGFELKLIHGEPALIIDGSEWYGKTFEECVIDATHTIQEWYEEKYQDEWESEGKISKIWEERAS